MMIALFNWFVKITGWPVQFLCFRTKILYEDRKVQGRHVKGSAIILSNHTSVFDYAVYLFVFFTRTLRFQMAEVLFEKPLLGLFLKCLGGIRVDRNAHDFGFLPKSEKILERGGVIGVFPESRLPLPGEDFYNGDVTYHQRDGKHFLSRYDWARYMAYIKANLNK